MTLSQDKKVAFVSQHLRNHDFKVFSQDWHQQTVYLKEIEFVLLSLPGIEDCAVLPRKTEQSEIEFVAYLVCSEPFNLERCSLQIQDKLPVSLIPQSYVPVSAIPLTADGEVNEQALNDLVVCDQTLIQRWQ